MKDLRPYTLSIAGFDPTGGAGILADCKTFEQTGSLGMGVCTAITYQTEDSFEGIEWLSVDSIKQQISILLKRYFIKHIKIGIIEDIEKLDVISDFIKELSPEAKIIWDPVLKISSAASNLHEDIEIHLLEKIMTKCFLVTPNLDEAVILFGKSEKFKEEIEDFVSRTSVNVLLKGGHDKSSIGKAIDVLYSKEGIHNYIGEKYPGFQKHGTGCILSAAITSNLSNGHSLQDSCRMAKSYIEKVIQSNTSLLAYHK